jgi:hypothetical protein
VVSSPEVRPALPKCFVGWWPCLPTSPPADGLSWGFALLQSIVCSQVALFWTSSAFPRILLSGCAAVFPDYRSPPSCDEGSCSHEVVPCRACCLLPARRPVGRLPLPVGSFLFNDIPWASPVWSRLFRACPGSALRFSQPRSGFPAGPSFAALFRAAHRS